MKIYKYLYELAISILCKYKAVTICFIFDFIYHDQGEVGYQSNPSPSKINRFMISLHTFLSINLLKKTP